MEQLEATKDQKRSGEVQTGGFGGFGQTDQKRSGETQTGGFGDWHGPLGGFGTSDSSKKHTGDQARHQLFDSMDWPSTPSKVNNNNNVAPQQEAEHRAAKHRRDEAQGVLQPARLVFDTDSSSSAGQRFSTILPDPEKLIRENERLRIENEKLRAGAERTTSWSQTMQQESDYQQAVALQRIERLEYEKAQLSQKVRELTTELQKAREVYEAEERRTMQRHHDDTTKTIAVDAIRREFEGLSVDRQPSKQPKQPMRSGADQPQRSFQQPQGAPHPYNLLHSQRPMEDRQPQQSFRQQQDAHPPRAFLQELKGRHGDTTYDDHLNERHQRVEQQAARFNVQSQTDDDGTQALLAQTELSQKYFQKGK